MAATKEGMRLEASWYQVLKEVIQSEPIQTLKAFLEEEKKNGYTVYPPEKLVFNAFLQTPYEKVKVVLMGQDPYHGPNQAEGLCFSVPSGIPFPPSLKNIFKELQDDLGLPIPQSGSLLPWAKQGVLLLNATLTVRKNSPLSHHGKGWEYFTDAVVEKLVLREDPLVFVLWGRSAQEKIEKFFNNAKHPHALLKAAHPSPYSAYNGFFGCRHFSKINEYLKTFGKEPIDWRLD